MPAVSVASSLISVLPHRAGLSGEDLINYIWQPLHFVQMLVQRLGALRHCQVRHTWWWRSLCGHTVRQG